MFMFQLNPNYIEQKKYINNFISYKSKKNFFKTLRARKHVDGRVEFRNIIAIMG